MCVGTGHLRDPQRRWARPSSRGVVSWQSRPGSPPSHSQNRGRSRAVGPRCPPPAVTINRSWLGKQGRGRVLIAQPASLFQKKCEQHTPNPPVQLPNSHPHQEGPEPKASKTGTSRNFSAHHSSFHTALSPKSAEEEAFCQELQKGSRCKSSSGRCQQVPCQRHARVHSCNTCTPALMPFTPSLCCKNTCFLS